MIAGFHGLYVDPTDLSALQIAFRDSQDLDWMVRCRVPLSAQDLERVLHSIELLATDPTTAIQLGIISKDDYDKAILAREEWKAKGGGAHRGVH